MFDPVPSVTVTKSHIFPIYSMQIEEGKDLVFSD